MMDPARLNPDPQAAIERLNTPSRRTGGAGMQTLGQADFLRLLTTQLTLQDPLKPADNEAMLAQMAQFSALATSTEKAASLEAISAKLDRLIALKETAFGLAPPAGEAALPPSS